MARPPVYPGLMVQLTDANGQRYPEYYDARATQESGATTFYLEARAGSEFEIGFWFFKVFPRDRSVDVTIYVDGTKIRRGIVDKDTIATHPDYGRVVKSRYRQEGKEWLEQRFRFDDLNLRTILRRWRLCLGNGNFTRSPSAEGRRRTQIHSRDRDNQDGISLWHHLQRALRSREHGFARAVEAYQERGGRRKEVNVN